MNTALREVTQLFLKLGFTAFGGPAAHIAMMQREVVAKRGWMSNDHFMDLVGATNLIPGPNSTEMAIHLGQERAGLKGLVVAGLCFIVPAVLITTLFAWLYKSYGQLPELQAYIYGIKPAILSVMVAAVLPLARTTLKGTASYLVAGMVLAAAIAGLNELLLLLLSGMVMLLWQRASKQINSLVPFGLLPLISNTKLFFTFLKIGSVLYGSGYVLFAFLDSELVSQGLLSRQQLVDAIAVGQFTPGPVFSAVTFVGYQINGFSGAALSTLAVFLPSFIFVWLLNPLIPKMRESAVFRNFLNGVNIASLMLIVYVVFQMAGECVNDWKSSLIALASLVVSLGFKQVNSAFLVLGGSVLGFILSFL